MLCGGDLQRVAREINISSLMPFISTSVSSIPSMSTPVGVNVVSTDAHDAKGEKLQNQRENRKITKSTKSDKHFDEIVIES